MDHGSYYLWTLRQKSLIHRRNLTVTHLIKTSSLSRNAQPHTVRHPLGKVRHCRATQEQMPMSRLMQSCCKTFNGWNRSIATLPRKGQHWKHGPLANTLYPELQSISICTTYCPEAHGTIISPTATVQQNCHLFVGYRKWINIEHSTGHIELIPQEGHNPAHIPIYLMNNLCYHYHSHMPIQGRPSHSLPPRLVFCKWRPHLTNSESLL